jgi:hypothetical protein
MTVILTPEQSALYDEGGWDAFHIEERIVEDLIQQGITEPCVVTLDTGEILFAISAGGRL